MVVTVKRVPIIVNRIPIIDPDLRYQRMMDKVHAKREELVDDKDILKIARYYEYKCRQVNGVTGWRCLSTSNYKKHRNWKHLTKIYELCTQNHYDYKVYIDSQFARVVNWKYKTKYPPLNTCYSPTAIKAYENYVKDYSERYSVAGTIKPKTEIPQNCKDEIIDTIIQDCNHFVALQQKAPKMRKYRGLTLQQIKFMYIADNVTMFSQYYWASLPWAVAYLQSFNSPWVKDMVEKVQQLQSSKSMMKLIHLIVPEVEKQMNVVSTLLPEEFAKTVEQEMIG